MIAKTFLRLERDFDKHVTYCRDEPLAQEFIADRAEVKKYFEVSSFRRRSWEIYSFRLLRLMGVCVRRHLREISWEIFT